MTEVTCPHCAAANTINVSAGWPGGDLKWECTPCGKVAATAFPPGPDAVVAISDSDAGAGADTN